MILNEMMPWRDSWSVLTELRKYKSTVPTVKLTARDKTPDNVKGLELAADDYLVKLFEWAEFTARIKPLLRRSPLRLQGVVRIGDLELDLLCMKVVRGGKVII